MRPPPRLRCRWNRDYTVRSDRARPPTAWSEDRASGLLVVSMWTSLLEITQKWLNLDRLGLAIVPWHRRPLRRTQAPPGPFEIFWRVRYGEKFYYRCGPLPTPPVMMNIKLSLLGIPSKNSISLWLVAAAHLSTKGANKDVLHSKLYQTVHAKQRGS